MCRHEPQHISTMTGYGLVDKGSIPRAGNFIVNITSTPTLGPNLTGPGISPPGTK